MYPRLHGPGSTWLSTLLPLIVLLSLFLLLFLPVSSVLLVVLQMKVPKRFLLAELHHFWAPSNTVTNPCPWSGSVPTQKSSVRVREWSLFVLQWAFDKWRVMMIDRRMETVISSSRSDILDVSNRAELLFLQTAWLHGNVTRVSVTVMARDLSHFNAIGCLPTRLMLWRTGCRAKWPTSYKRNRLYDRRDVTAAVRSTAAFCDEWVVLSPRCR